MRHPDDRDSVGEFSVESWGAEPLCSFDSVSGFSLNRDTLNELRWYTYLGPDELDVESLLQSEHD